MFKKTIISLLCFIIGYFLWHANTILYGFRQARGQFNIIANTRNIQEVLADQSFPDSLKKQIRLIQEIKQFAVDSLGLKPSDNYTTFYDQHHKPLMWVITASEPFALRAKTFAFPILGEFSYKGHFEESLAKAEATDLERQGFDTRIGNASAWSTLGYLKDPILSSMLYKPEGQLAALIIHELTHGTLFIKNNLSFNENLADFVGDYGALRFLEAKYGKNSKQWREYQLSKRYADAYSQHILRGTKKLDSLYRNFSVQTTFQSKRSQKESLILQIMNNADTLLGGKKSRVFDKNNLPNNAFFIAYQTYQSQQNEFEREFRTQFKSDFKTYLAYLAQKYE